MEALRGFFWLMLASVTESRTPNIIPTDSEEWKCNNLCDNARGYFCLLDQCIPCGDCPDNPFDLDPTGHLTIYNPCLKNGFCPKVCSSFLQLGNYPRANETFCDRINAPKETTVQPWTREVVETTATIDPGGVSSTKPATKRVETYPVKETNNDDHGLPTYVIVLVVMAGVGLCIFFLKCPLGKFRKRPSSSQCSLTEDTDEFSYEPLEVRYAENKTLTVKGLQRLKCTALQLCACFPNPDYPAQNYIYTDGLDEVQLQGPMIPNQDYTVRAGRVSAKKEFECIAEGKVRTEEFTNDTLEDTCSTTVEEIFENYGLRKSLQIELDVQPDMVSVISSVFKLKGDIYLSFKADRDLGKLCEELQTVDDTMHSSVHILMEGLHHYSVAKDFMRKIAKRDTNRYCKKCLEFLHRQCCGNPDERVVQM